MTSTTKQKSGRGGPRPNSGRPAVLGDNERKSVRLPYELIKLATRMGNGNFSDGTRVLLTVAEHVLMRPGNEPPGPNEEQPVKYCVTDDNRSVLAYFDPLRMDWTQTGMNAKPVNVLYWCNVPLTPGEVNALLTSE